MTTIQITTNNLRDNDLFKLHSILHSYQKSFPTAFSYNSEFITMSDEFPKKMIFMLYKDLNNFSESYDEFKYITLD